MQNQSYAIDALISAVEGISTTPPVFFQLNGDFYVVSHNCMGKMSYGLSTTPINTKREDSRWRAERQEILHSVDVIVKRSEHDNESTTLLPGEGRYIGPLIMNKDREGVLNLEHLFGVAKELGKIKDDGRIRLVSHDVQYHSHKHGYAADGVDVWLRDARLMTREGYLDLMRKKEEAVVDALVTGREESTDIIYSDTLNSRFGLQLPDVTILTPHIMATFPREGSIDHREEDKGWTTKTNLGKPHWPSFRRVGTYSESPFNLNVTINMHQSKSGKVREVGESLAVLMERTQSDLAGLKKADRDIDCFLYGLNQIHNRVFAKNFEQRKKWETKP